MKLTEKTKLDFNAFIEIFKTVYEVKEVTSTDINDNHGTIKWKRGIISIAKELNYTNRFQTLIHEVTHAIFYHAGFEEYLRTIKKIDDLEFITTMICNGFSEFLLSNKEQVRGWLMADNHGGIMKELK